MLEHELKIRTGFFIGILFIMWLWETLSPSLRLRQSRRRRWSRNLSLSFINAMLLRLILPSGLIGVALWAENLGAGILRSHSFSKALSDFSFVPVVVSVIFLDFVVFLQHLSFHVFTPFWRLHQVHHADRDFDVTTGSRFHSFEIFFSALIKGLAIVLVGVPAAAVLIFEVLLSASAMFNHGNVSLPKSLDGFLRLVLVTPDMHRVHHSVFSKETHTNYGFCLSWWDRLFRTYSSHWLKKDTVIGLKHTNESGIDRDVWLPHRLLYIPFCTPPGDYPKICSPLRRTLAKSSAAVFFFSLGYAVYLNF